MAKIENMKKGKNSGGYARVLGHEELGCLISRVHSTVISNGTELERMINRMLKEKGQLVPDVDAFLDSKILPMNGTYVFPKKAIKKSKKIDFHKSEPDFVILKISQLKRHCHIIELKDGFMFDTKKSASEKETLQKFSSHIAQYIEYSTQIHICSFHEPDKKIIAQGFKGVFSEQEILTGQEFCQILEIDYNEIIESRKVDQKINFEFFVRSLLNIPDVKEKLLAILEHQEY